MTEAAALAEPFAGRRVLITGGLGFLGSNLAHSLVEAGAEVTLVDSLAPQYGGSRANVEGIESRVRIEVADLRDEARTAAAVRGRELVLNLAGQTSHLDSMRDPFTDLETNCRAQLVLLEACRRESPGAKVVFASTRQIYGRPLRIPVTEDHPIAPVDVNGVHKAAGEWYHRLYGEVYGLRVCSLRLTNTYGPRMRVRDARQTFLGVWLAAAARRGRFEVWGDGTQLRDFTYVDDAVRALLLAAARDEADGEALNLGGPPVTLLEVAELLRELEPGCDFRLVPFPADREPIDIGGYAGDWSRIRERLGWEPLVPLREGLERSLAFLREHGERYWGDGP